MICVYQMNFCITTNSNHVQALVMTDHCACATILRDLFSHVLNFIIRNRALGNFWKLAALHMFSKNAIFIYYDFGSWTGFILCMEFEITDSMVLFQHWRMDNAIDIENVSAYSEHQLLLWWCLRCINSIPLVADEVVNSERVEKPSLDLKKQTRSRFFLNLIH